MDFIEPDYPCAGEEAIETLYDIFGGDWFFCNYVFDMLGNDRSVGEWIFDAVNGNVKTYGLELLDKTFWGEFKHENWNETGA